MKRKSTHRGRGAVTNRAGRFEVRDVAPLEDEVWWEIEEPAERIPTTVLPDATRTLFATNDSPDVPFGRSINPYRGCEHGCTYCFARPSHAYLGFSAGLDFETKIVAKHEAPALLRGELARKSYRCEVVALGANTDAYQPVERRLRITRGILEELWRHRHPVCVVTKSALVVRDIDLLRPMAERDLVKVLVSVTSLDPELARRMEPRAASPTRRLRTIETLARAGVPVGVLASPMIPALNDHELDAILARAAAAGATSAGTILLRIPHELREVFRAWLEEAYPRRAAKVLGILSSMRGGTLYEAEFGKRMSGRGPFAELLARRFEVACRRHGLERASRELDTSRFRVPGRPVQRTLFGEASDR